MQGSVINSGEFITRWLDIYIIKSGLNIIL